VIPLIDLYVHFFVIPVNTSLAAFDASLTWVLCIISGAFFTVGSWVFIRAFEDPTPPPLLPKYYHTQTDELLGTVHKTYLGEISLISECTLGAWLFLLGMIPTVPYCIEYILDDSANIVYWGALVGSVVFTFFCAFFLYCCYPANMHLLTVTLVIFLLAKTLIVCTCWNFSLSTRAENKNISILCAFDSWARSHGF
jgi:hypothetical protein